MTDDKVRELLHDTAEGIEPGDRLAAIRSATAGRGRRTTWGWWATGGAGLVAASVLTAMVVGGGANPQESRPGPATSPASGASPSATTSPTEPTNANSATQTVAVYYVGDTPDGPRLYREFRRLPGDVLVTAVDAAVGRDSEGAPLAPLDPDYRVPWPAGTTAEARVDPSADLIEISLGRDVEGGLRDRGSLSEADASMAVEQLIRTAQGVVAERLPVRFLLDGEITDQVLGVPTAEPLAAGPTLETLAHVSISDPSEGRKVDNDEPFIVWGVGNSFEGNIVTRIQRWESTDVVAEKPAIAGWMEDRLFPFKVVFDLSAVPPGDYVVISMTDDPSGQGRIHTDTRTITVVD